MVVAPSAQTVSLVWSVSILLGLVVTVVVALLLQAILNTARLILKVASDIWTDGQRVANNTVHIAMLDRTNYVLGGILAEAGAVAQASARIAEAVRHGGGTA
ncbi:MAG: hypothetical protein QN183_03295 [Armatimonadota bacterium]|nr:hypothetical protein [Armatimonadota bacterium]MDR7535376.1 hypothetical protein [Armatimonadota bacterium]